MNIPEKVAPLLVHNVGWTPTAYGTWGLLITSLGTLTGWIIAKGPAWIKSRSDAFKQNSETGMAEARNRAEMDAAVVAQRIAADQALAARVTALEDRAQKAESVAMYLTGALATTLNALRAQDPNNAAIPQASNLIEMAIAAGGEGVFAKGLAKLAMVKGTGE